MSNPPDRTSRRDGARSPRTVALVVAVPVVALVAVLATWAIRGSSDSTSASAPSPHTIVIENFSFEPPTLTVDKGTKLTVENEDGTAHTLSARDGSFDTGTLDGGERTVLTLRTTGIFEYRCKIHQYMTGKLIVR